MICCTNKLISVKILVICAINSFVIENAFYGVIFTSCLFQKPSLVRVLTQTTLNPVRHTFYDVNHISLLCQSNCDKHFSVPSAHFHVSAADDCEEKSNDMCQLDSLSKNIVC